MSLNNELNNDNKTKINDSLISNLSDLKMNNYDESMRTSNDGNDGNEINENDDESDEFHDCELNNPIDENDSETPIHELTDDEYAKEMESHLNDEQLKQKRDEAIDMKNKGNELFKQLLYDKSIAMYTDAVRHCPTIYTDDRSVMYANRAAAFIHTDNKTKAIDDCTKAIQLNGNYVKAYLRRAQLLRESDEKLDDALNDYKKIIELEPNCVEARAACAQLPLIINERNERLKQEMMGKLKDLGNMMLRPFGLSTDNFKMDQNPETGGYNINFKN